MRKNLAKHAAKKLPLAKRVLALCFALIFVCSCLLPAFANGAGTDFTDLTEDTSTVVEESMDTVEDTAPAEDLSVSEDLTADDGAATLEDGFGVDTMDESFGVDDGVAALDDDYAVDDGASTLDDDPISQPVGGIDLPIAVDPTPVVDGTDTPKEGAVNVTTDKDGNIVYEYDTSDVTFDDDFVVSQPDGDHALDKVDAAFAIPTNTYRFWLSEKDSYDLAEIASDAAAADLTEDEYLNLHGESKGLFHMMYVADGANLADYKFTSPTSVDDPSGNSRTFAGWYTIDDLGDKHDFKFDDYLYTSKSKTVDVYAKWEKAVDEKYAKYAGWYAELMKCSDSEFNKLWAKYNDAADYDKFYEYIDSLTSEEQKALADRMNDNFEYQGATIATYADYQWADAQVQATTSTEQASIFYLKKPGNDPKSNLKSDWGTNRIAIGMVTVPTDNNSWQRGTDNYGNTQYYKNLYDNLGSRITWPDGTTGLEWTISKDSYSTAWNEIWSAYKTSIESELEKKLTEDDIDTITLVAYKISRNNAETPDKHIDCKVVVKCKQTYTANFWVEYVDVDGDNLVWSHNYNMDESVDKTSADKNLKYTSTWFNGIEYVFDGWYNEAGRKVSESEWPYKPDPDTELKDGEVNFYAKYIPKNSALEDSPYITVEKQISGLDSLEKLPDDFYIAVDRYKLYVSAADSETTSDGKIILRWTIPVDAGTYWVTEKNYQVNGYDVTVGGSEQNVTTAKANIDVKLVGEVIKTCSNQDFEVKSTDNEDVIFVAALHTGNQDTNLVISYNPLSAGVREALKSKLNSTFLGSGDWNNTKTAFYSIREAGNEFAIANTVVTYNETTQKIHISARSNWTKAATLKWDTSGGINPEILVTNDYTPNTSDLTVTKTVTGLLGDREKQFNFTLSFDQSVDLSKNLITWKKSDGTEGTLAGQTYTFTLSHGQSIVFSGIPAGVTATVAEDECENYTAKYKIHNTGDIFNLEAATEGRSASVTIDATAKTIQFLNHNDAEPDMGVLLDTLPYLVILAVVVGGAVLLIARKHKHDDE